MNIQISLDARRRGHERSMSFASPTRPLVPAEAGT